MPSSQHHQDNVKDEKHSHKVSKGTYWTRQGNVKDESLACKVPSGAIWNTLATEPKNKKDALDLEKVSGLLIDCEKTLWTR
jgi:hypothetical protein